MKGQMKSFLLFIVGIFVILILVQTVFGQGIAYNILGFLSETEPAHLQDEIRTMLTEASYAPGEYEGKIKIDFKRNVTIKDEPYHTVSVETAPQFAFTTEELKPIAFLSNCNVVKTCTKECRFIGEHCRVTSQCCAGLECNHTTLICESLVCGNGAIDNVEECDIGNITSSPTTPQCSDGIDNDVNGTCDFNGCCSIYHIPLYNQIDCQINGGNWLPPDTECNGDPNGKEADKKCPGNCLANCTCPNIVSNEGENCNNDIDCKRTKCLSKVSFNQIGGILVVKKIFEGYTCKLKIEKE